MIKRVTDWAAGRPDVFGLLLVGSYARGAARPDSDVDLVLLSPDPAAHTWIDELALGTEIRTQAWGIITERRFATPSGLEVEIGIGPPQWANTNPVDPGTHRVITDGSRILHDPTGSLARLRTACRT